MKCNLAITSFQNLYKTKWNLKSIDLYLSICLMT